MRKYIGSLHSSLNFEKLLKEWSTHSATKNSISESNDWPADKLKHISETPDVTESIPEGINLFDFSDCISLKCYNESFHEAINFGEFITVHSDRQLILFITYEFSLERKHPKAE